MIVAVVLATAGLVWTPHDPLAVVGPPWSPDRGLLGTDALGRDVLSRVLAGGATLTAVALLAALCASAAGIAWGLVAGWTGRGVAFLADVLLAVPFLVLALLFAVTLPGWAAVVVGTVCAGAPLTARLVADLTRRTRTAGYVEAALGRGESTASVLVREVLPSVGRYAVADAGMRFVLALQLASALAVLGFGAAPPTPDWGLMLRENLPGAVLNPAGLLAPAVALAALSLCVALAAQRPVPRLPRRRAGAPATTAERGLTACHLSVVDSQGRVLLDDFSLRIEPGEVVALTGPSGAGKTIALRALLDTVDGDAVRVTGTVRWHGVPVRAARRWRRTHVGVLDQDPAGTLDPRHTIGRALGPRGLEVLARLGLDPAEFRDRLPDTLSGGQARRVALALALAGNPPVLALDEPTAGLDPDSAHLVATAVESRRGDHVTVVVTHDLSFADRVADRVVPVGDLPVPAAARGTHTIGPVVLAAIDLTVHDGQWMVLDDIALSVAEGELVAVLGDSGSGKSTLLRVLAGLVRSTGRITLRGTEIPGQVRDRDRDTLRAVQFLAQDPAVALNPAHTAGTALTRPLRRLTGLDRTTAAARVPGLLGAVGLPADTADRHPARLSGGQRQRVALARALAPGPAVLLADEPTAALDAATASAVLALLDDLRATGLGVLVATHDPAVAARADRCLRLTAGRLTPAEPPIGDRTRVP